jgi:hypothetical protein
MEVKNRAQNRNSLKTADNRHSFARVEHVATYVASGGF